MKRALIEFMVRLIVALDGEFENDGIALSASLTIMN